MKIIIGTVQETGFQKEIVKVISSEEYSKAKTKKQRTNVLISAASKFVPESSIAYVLKCD